MNAAQASLNDWQALYKVYQQCLSDSPTPLTLTMYHLLTDSLQWDLYWWHLSDSAPRDHYLQESERPCFTCRSASIFTFVSLSQIAETFSSDLHNVASIINKVVCLLIKTHHYSLTISMLCTGGLWWVPNSAALLSQAQCRCRSGWKWVT